MLIPLLLSLPLLCPSLTTIPLTFELGSKEDAPLCENVCMEVLDVHRNDVALDYGLYPMAIGCISISSKKELVVAVTPPCAASFISLSSFQPSYQVLTLENPNMHNRVFSVDFSKAYLDLRQNGRRSFLKGLVCSDSSRARREILVSTFDVLRCRRRLSQVFLEESRLEHTCPAVSSAFFLDKTDRLLKSSIFPEDFENYQQEYGSDGEDTSICHFFLGHEPRCGTVKGEWERRQRSSPWETRKQVRVLGAPLDRKTGIELSPYLEVESKEAVMTLAVEEMEISGGKKEKKEKEKGETDDIFEISRKLMAGLKSLYEGEGNWLDDLEKFLEKSSAWASAGNPGLRQFKKNAQTLVRELREHFQMLPAVAGEALQKALKDSKTSLEEMLKEPLSAAKDFFSKKFASFVHANMLFQPPALVETALSLRISGLVCFTELRNLLSRFEMRKERIVRRSNLFLADFSSPNLELTQFLGELFFHVFLEAGNPMEQKLSFHLFSALMQLEMTEIILPNLPSRDGDGTFPERLIALIVFQAKLHFMDVASKFSPAPKGFFKGLKGGLPSVAEEELLVLAPPSLNKHVSLLAQLNNLQANMPRYMEMLKKDKAVVNYVANLLKTAREYYWGPAAEEGETDWDLDESIRKVSEASSVDPEPIVKAGVFVPPELVSLSAALLQFSRGFYDALSGFKSLKRNSASFFVQNYHLSLLKSLAKFFDPSPFTEFAERVIGYAREALYSSNEAVGPEALSDVNAVLNCILVFVHMSKVFPESAELPSKSLLDLLPEHLSCENEDNLLEHFSSKQAAGKREQKPSLPSTLSVVGFSGIYDKEENVFYTSLDVTEAIQILRALQASGMLEWTTLEGVVEQMALELHGLLQGYIFRFKIDSENRGASVAFSYSADKSFARVLQVFRFVRDIQKTIPAEASFLERRREGGPLSKELVQKINRQDEIEEARRQRQETIRRGDEERRMHLESLKREPKIPLPVDLNPEMLKIKLYTGFEGERKEQERKEQERKEQEMEEQREREMKALWEAVKPGSGEGNVMAKLARDQKKRDRQRELELSRAP